MFRARWQFEGSRLGGLACFLLAAAFVLGGSVRFPLVEAVIECLAVMLLLAAVCVEPAQRWRQIPVKVWVVVALICLLPALQLVDLPAHVWQALPGRQDEISALALVGQDQVWRPLTLTPSLTLGSLLAAIALSAAFLVFYVAGPSGWRNLRVTFLACTALAVLVGGAQLAGGPAGVFRFYEAQQPFLVGFQANHNAAADVFVLAMIALVMQAQDWSVPRRRRYMALLSGAFGVLALATLLTASRTGICLMVLPLGLALQCIAETYALGRRQQLWLLGSVLALAGMGIGLMFLFDNNLSAALARFATGTELRPEIWSDVLYCIRLFFPFGSGLGSFVPVFEAHESLSLVSDRYINAAHNDYLQWFMEGGVAGLVILLAIGGILAGALWRGIRHADLAVRRQALGFAAGLGVFVFHSIDDYPIRTFSLAFLATAFAANALRCGSMERVAWDLKEHL